MRLGIAAETLIRCVGTRSARPAPRRPVLATDKRRKYRTPAARPYTQRFSYWFGQQPRLARRTALSRAVFACLSVLLAASAEASIQRLVLQPDTKPASQELRGITEITVLPPFEKAKVSIFLDGKMISSTSLPPHRVEVDFGTAGIEHRISVVAKAEDGKRSEWSHIVNRGNHPLTVTVRHESGVAEPYIEAKVTSPKEDPVVSVEFFDGSAVIGQIGQRPYRISVPPGYDPPVLYATARTKSGAEETDFLATAAGVAIESFQLRTVPIFVSVVDQKGAARNGLKRSDFKIVDNGRPTRILEFAPALNQPISIALLMDASGSMGVDLPGAADAAVRFVKSALRNNDRLTFFAIRDVPRREMAITGGWQQIEETIRGLKPGGSTAVYDAITSSIRELSSERNRRAIVVFTDGQDTSSNATFDDTLENAKRAGIPVYVVAYGPSENFGQELERLRLLAGDTGAFITVAATNNLHQKFEQIATDLRSQYAIRYQVGDTSKSNEWRPIKVVLNSPRLTARTIKGYFTP